MTILVLSILVSIISVTLTRSTLFDPVRTKLGEINQKLGELVSCPYCAGHWISAFITCIAYNNLDILVKPTILNYAVCWAVILFASMCLSWILVKILEEV
jgi:hypothetical protein